MVRRKWKALGLLITLTAVFVLAACGTKENSDSGSSSPTTSASAATGGTPTIDAIKSKGKLVVGVKFDTRLFGLKDPASGNVEGFDIDIAKGLAKQLLGDETKIELREVTSKTRIPMLDNGEIDLIIATMTINEERRKQVDFSEVYFNAGQSLLVKKGSPIQSVADVKKGTKVMAVKGATSVKNIKEKAPDATVLEFDNYQDAFSALRAGQGDALTTDNAILYGMASQDSNYEVVGGTFTEEPYGIAAKKGNADLVNAVNEYLASLKSSGEYDKIYEKWIGETPLK
ncbi:transporter substrate-binding domain-containing protein [Cohnella luojiensis]|uniref:Transporter substrate-binding domain-containing protein n=1 Tax=Cohnella luojiensis TaxID=652876 RepID=A0A4Y8LWG8_9BACL|nr:transporter substrate-binding domain-containing protein [Cohnella luojiensis]TFE25578.1 transporter substrate-binding domain-containing protein [Cohnella luojiensis]